MQLETVLVMVTGLVALAIVRLIMAVVGRAFDEDHPEVHVPARAADAPDLATLKVYRGTGKRSHLLYFQPAPARSVSGEPTGEPSAFRPAV